MSDYLPKKVSPIEHAIFAQEITGDTLSDTEKVSATR